MSSKSLSTQFTTPSALVRAATYARYSTDAQRPSSIADQMRRCQRYADEHGYHVVASFADEAGKGWSPDRAQYQAMLTAAKRGEFQVLLVDDLSRAFRDAAEQALALRRLALWGVHVVAVAEGWDSRQPGAKLMAGIKGLLNETYLDSVALMTRRGIEGRALEGMSTGGAVYGYKTKAVTEGGREIGHERLVVEEEAEVVRKIYQLYADGHSPMSIAEYLNARGVPGPRGDKWSRNAIYGDRRDLSGILNNPVYVGQLVWNRSTFIRDPESGKRLKRRNAESEWVRTDVPQLRVISAELAQEVRARMDAVERKGAAIRAGLGEKARNGADGKYLLTGLLTCGACGGPISSVGRNLFGCSARHNRGVTACSNDVKFRRDAAEVQLLSAVETELFTPAAVERFIEHLMAELNAQSASGDSAIAAHRAALLSAERGIEGCLSFIERGNASPAVAARLTAWEQKAAEARTSIRRIEDAPKLTDADRNALRAAGMDALRQLPHTLSGLVPETRNVLSRLLRGPSPVFASEDGSTLEIKMAGTMAGLLTIQAAKHRKAARLVNVVAGARFELATFGLCAP